MWTNYSRFRKPIVVAGADEYISRDYYYTYGGFESLIGRRPWKGSPGTPKMRLILN